MAIAIFKRGSEPSIPIRSSSNTGETIHSAYITQQACIVHDLITGQDHAAHSKKQKKTLKSLSNKQDAKDVITYLKKIPKDDVVVSCVTDNPFEAEVMPKQQALEAILPGVGQLLSMVSSPTTSSKGKDKGPKEPVITSAFWWGYEIAIPHSQMSRLSSAQNVASAFLGFLSVVSMTVPQIKPFLTYISAWVGLEFSAMKAEDEGNGIILAATWLLPIAIVPRPWDL